jgi:hypothetical protein
MLRNRGLSSDDALARSTLRVKLHRSDLEWVSKGVENRTGLHTAVFCLMDCVSRERDGLSRRSDLSEDGAGGPAEWSLCDASEVLTGSTNAAPAGRTGLFDK